MGFGKKGQMKPIGWVVIILIAAYVFVPGVNTAVKGLLGGSGGTTNIFTQPATPGQSNPVITLSPEDVTVTFSSWDSYSQGTNAGKGHRALTLDGKQNVIVVDDGTQTMSPGDAYTVLLGNITTGISPSS